MYLRNRSRSRIHSSHLGLGSNFERSIKLQNSSATKLKARAKPRKCLAIQTGQSFIFEKIELSYFFIEPSISKFEALMDWINCNTCCRQPGDDKDRIFMLSSCGHIFCDNCLSKFETKDKCKVCSTQCQLIHLSSKMKPDTQIFFQDPTNLLKQHQMQLTKLLEFQKEHRTRLVTFHRKMASSPFISPGVSRISPGRLTLVKANSPASKVIHEGSNFSQQESPNKGTTQYVYQRAPLSYHAHGAKLNSDVGSGVPLYGSLSSDGKRTPSPVMSRLSSSTVSSPSVMHQSFQPSQPIHYSQGYLASKSYSHLHPGSQLMKSSPNQMQRGNFSNGPQPMIYSPDPSPLQRSLGARSFSKY